MSQLFLALLLDPTAILGLVKVVFILGTIVIVGAVVMSSISLLKSESPISRTVGFTLLVFLLLIGLLIVFRLA
ncbi:hypothetical protein I5L79_17820 [Hymenobacter sp. BT594]|uniref:DUF1328 domain-containing protein n=1 Tax=Hymenobacter guriensis TaxID=2793065 RepID=A0ABS0L5L1_9BACT|nr:hypothetical protein [Hymenobacter guriensis]